MTSNSESVISKIISKSMRSIMIIEPINNDLNSNGTIKTD
jgi:hypothetical protein